jgi:hypothetical protein
LANFESQKQRVEVLVLTVAWDATIYHIWCNRNARIHNDIIRTEEGIFHAVLHDVRCRLMTCERIKNNQHRVIYCMWQVLFHVFDRK